MKKDCWLKTNGNINSKLTFCWVDKINSPKITDVEIIWEKEQTYTLSSRPKE